MSLGFSIFEFFFSPFHFLLFSPVFCSCCLSFSFEFDSSKNYATKALKDISIQKIYYLGSFIS